MNWVRKEKTELGQALPRLVCNEEAMRARQSYGGGVRKTEEEKGDERRWHKLNSVAQKQEEATKEPSPRQREAEDGHARAWNREEGHRR